MTTEMDALLDRLAGLATQVRSLPHCDPIMLAADCDRISYEIRATITDLAHAEETLRTASQTSRA